MEDIPGKETRIIETGKVKTSEYIEINSESWKPFGFEVYEKTSEINGQYNASPHQAKHQEEETPLMFPDR